MRRYWPYLIIGVVVVLVVGLGLGGRIWYSNNLEALNPGDTSTLNFKVEEGMSSEEIARKLEDNDLIRSQLAFRLYLRFQGASGDIQAGVYQFSPSESVADITRKLISGEIAARLVTITPGMRIDQVVNRLRQEDYTEADINAALSQNYPYSILKDKPPQANLEGYLYPETYLVGLDTPVEELIDLILATTDEKVSPEIRQGWAAQGLNLHQGLTLSSIVIREVANAEDQRKVAQVFLKRLAIGRKLEADPTFEYAAAVLGVEPSISLDSPYNTYLYEGLPPGPIANPDAQAMQAVANPTKTDFLFFLSDEDGNTHFTDNEDKHKQNIEEFLN